MIVKDEEKLLERCLNLIKDKVDEIIIVDTGSKDKTREIAKKFTENVYDFKWRDDFSKARNLSVSRATKGWILALDPDERIEKNDLKRIKSIVKENKKGILGYRLIQKTYHNNRVISTRGICRIFKNDKKIRFVYPIHETVKPSIKRLNGKTGKTGIIIEHYPKISKKKQEYYLRLLKIKKKKFPESNVDKEIENEYNFFNPQ